MSKTATFPRRRTKADQEASRLRSEGFATAKSPSELAKERKKPNELKALYHRNRAQLAPIAAAGSVWAAATVPWSANGLLGGPNLGVTAVTAAASAGAALFVSTQERVRKLRWSKRIRNAAWVGAGFLIAGSMMDPSWSTVLPWTTGLVGAMAGLGAGYWRDVEITIKSPKPKEPEPVDVEPEESTQTRWAKYLGGRQKLLADSYLTDPEIEGPRERWTINLVPGTQSLNSVVAILDKVSSGVGVPQEQLIVEAHPSRKPELALLTVMRTSPIREPVILTEPQYFEDGPDAWLEPGGYSDGIGRVKVPFFAEDSARNTVIIGGQGSGKTAMMTQMAISALSSRKVCLWYLDGQDGVSSPELLEHADWAPTGVHREEAMLSALEKLFQARGLRMKSDRARGFTPSNDYPAVLVIVDECHEFFDTRDAKKLKRWENLIRKSRKLGVMFWVATQHPSVESFGNDQIRSLLMQFTAIVLRTQGAVAKNILRLDVDPNDLPTLPGFGYVIGGVNDDTRTAPFRADFLPKDIADEMFRKYPTLELDKASANGIGEEYVRRRELAEKQRQKELENLRKLIAGKLSFDDDDDDWDDEDESADIIPIEGGGTLKVLRMPTPKLGGEYAGLDSPVRVLEALRGGARSVKDIQERTGLSQSRAYEVVKKLTEEGKAVKVGRGQWEPAHMD